MFRTFSFPFRRVPTVTRALCQRMLVRFIVAVPPLLVQRPWFLSVVGPAVPQVPPPAPVAASDNTAGPAHLCVMHNKPRAEVDMIQLKPGMWVCKSPS